MKAIVKLTALFTVLALASIEETSAQTLTHADEAITDTLIQLMDDMGSREAELNTALNQPMPSTRAEQKARMRNIYVARVALAKAERTYFVFCASKAPDLESKSVFNRNAWAAKRRQDKFQAKVWQYTMVEAPSVQF